ncbi:MAG TPA: hypothetical protein VN231_10810 [Allosphingosinicella sp.]|nr:hypothetical protein [Allosphingosinicella sp.]
MRDPMEMTDAEFRLYQARQRAAKTYRFEGFPEFAQRVVAGFEDSCSQVRLQRFFVDPAPPLTAEFLKAWNELASAEGQLNHRPT